MDNKSGGILELRWIGLFGIAWLFVVGRGLFVPLMDNDSAHHANIALRMYLTGDYVRLIDYDGPYLDKPHLHFWLAALSYHLFGVTGFAYKFPSFLFCLVGIWAVYRTAYLLIGASAGRVAALIYATSTAFLLGLNDVRMDGILASAVAIAIWQIVGYLASRNIRYVVGAALGMAIGFCTKGHIGVFIPMLFLFFYLWMYKEWGKLLDVKLIYGVLSFFFFISPVVYCYYLQYNLHPEVMVRGKDHIDGVRFILWDQTLGRYGGEMGSDAKGDRLFFFHTFLWVFAPWSLIGLVSIIINRGVRNTGTVSKTILLVLLTFGVLVGFSSFKLPHYLNVILPLSSIWLAELLVNNWEKIKRSVLVIERLLWLITGVFIQFMLIWWFPEQSGWFWIGFVIYLVFLFYCYKQTEQTSTSGAVIRYSSVMLLLFWMINAAFYPALLKYQGGNMLADRYQLMTEKEPVFSLEGCYSSSFYFYTKTIRQVISVKDLKNRTGLVLLDEKQLRELDKAGIKWKMVDAVADYEITRLTGKFLDRNSRPSVCTNLLLIRFDGIS